MDLRVGSEEGEEARGYNCNYLTRTKGFECSGPTCEHPSGDGTC